MRSATWPVRRLALVAPLAVALAACAPAARADRPPPAATWFADCPVDAATVSAVVGVSVRQTTPDPDTPWCQFQADDGAPGVLVVNLDDRPGVSGDTLPAARRAHEEQTSTGCVQADAPSLGPDAFTSSCPASDDYGFVTATALFEIGGAIKEVGLTRGRLRGEPTNLAELAVAVAQRVRG